MEGVKVEQSGAEYRLETRGSLENWGACLWLRTGIQGVEFTASGLCFELEFVWLLSPQVGWGLYLVPASEGTKSALTSRAEALAHSLIFTCRAPQLSAAPPTPLSAVQQ